MEPFVNEDSAPTVSLKGGLDINTLRNSDGLTFELNEEAGQDYEDEVTTDYFNQEDVFNNLHHFEEEDSDEDDDSSPFEKMARKMTDISPDNDGGVMKQVLKEGSGPVVPHGSIVRVHFNAYFEYLSEPFDSSRLRNAVQKFRLGQGYVIEGWDIGIATMRQGEFSQFIIQPEYFLGPKGVPPRIHENSPALFEIELLSFVEKVGPDDFFNMTREERWAVPFSEIKKVYQTLVTEAKQMFEANYIKGAFPKYKKACEILEDMHMKNEEEEKEQTKLLLRVYLNMAVCLVKLGHSKRAIIYCRRCEDIDPNHPKALYLYGKALHQMCEFSRARQYLMRAQRLKPSSREVSEELEKLEKDLQKFKLTETSIYQKMFSQPVGETEQEKQTSDRVLEQKVDKSLQCSESFKRTLKEKLQEFRDNPDLVEFPLPSYSFTVGEIQCVLDAAEEMGLVARVKGSGNESKIQVMKKIEKNI